jgi:hypothetical protein
LGRILLETASSNRCLLSQNSLLLLSPLSVNYAHCKQRRNCNCNSLLLLLLLVVVVVVLCAGALP